MTTPTPVVVVFDVNETLSDLAPIGDCFAELGAPEWAAELWFATVLRDGFALTAAGSPATFRTVADGALRSVLASIEWSGDIDAAVEAVLGAFNRLRVHPDVAQGVADLRRQGHRLVTLTNGSTDVAERLLSSAGLVDQFEMLLSVDAVGVWKPAADAYLYAARSCGVAPDEMLLVAVHPWDVDGAARAGLQTAWVNRDGAPYPEYFHPPNHTVTALHELPARLAGRSP